MNEKVWLVYTLEQYEGGYEVIGICDTEENAKKLKKEFLEIYWNNSKNPKSKFIYIEDFPLNKFKEY